MRELFLLDPEVCFLNHGSFGACPRPVFERYQAWQAQLERQPVAFLDPERGYGQWMGETRQALAAVLGAEADDIVGCMNATAGLNLVARSLPLARGDEILTSDHEYAALEKTWSFVAKRTGARIVPVEIPLPLESATQFEDAMIGAMSDRTRVLFLSQITSPTALCFPLTGVIAEARRRGAFTVIDGAHSPGHVPLDLDALGADFFVGNCHKWLLAPKGAAFLYARKEWQSLLNPLVISHGWQLDREAPGPFGGSPFVDAMEIQGTRDPAAWLTVPAAILFQSAYDWPQIAASCSALAFETAQRIAGLCGTALLASRPYLAPQMVSVPLPIRDGAAFQAALYQRYRIEIPIVPWKAAWYLRLSVQCYNNQSELDGLVAAVAELLE